MLYERPISWAPDSEDQLLLALAGQPGRVLELGCSSGYFAAELQRRGAWVTGLDVDADAVAVARLRGIVAHVVDVEDPGSLAGLAGNYDLVVLANVLEHLRRPETVLSGIRSLLAGDGRILISVPNVAHLSVRRMLLRGRFDYTDSGIMDRTHLRFYTRDALRRQLTEGGWTVTAERSSPGLLADSLRGEAVRKLAPRFPGLLAVHLIAEARP